MARTIGFVGVLGWPLDHTLSPIIHNAAFRRLGMDWVYLSFPVPPERLADAVSGLRALGARGANVTMPHKESIVQYLDGLSSEAEELGAVNTVQQLGGKLIGHNTDVAGFVAFLTEDAGFDVTGRTALVLGAGGAARAVVKGLVDSGAAAITIAGRTPDRTHKIAGTSPLARSVAWDEAAGLVQDFDLIVNATPLGMAGEDPVAGASFRPGQTVVDLIYDPPVTPLVDKARAAGADAWSGLGMLVHQAVASFSIWTGRQPPVEAMSAVAVHALGLGRRSED
jgi:shikimate dehydrogenase